MAANGYIVPVREYGPDPHDRRAGGLFMDVWARIQGLRTHPYGVSDANPSTTFNGVAEAPQDFTGLRFTGDGTPYRNGGSPTMSDGLVEGPLGDPARRIFAQRLARRGGAL